MDEVKKGQPTQPVLSLVHDRDNGAALDLVAGLERSVAQTWLALIQEARLCGGQKAAVAMWSRSPLPHLPEMANGPCRTRPILGSVSHFLSKFVIADAMSRIPASALYCAYGDWLCPPGQPVRVPTQAAFGRVMRELGHRSERNGTVFYVGLRLKAPGCAGSPS